MTGATSDPEALVARVEELTAQLEQIGDPFARAAAEELAGALMELYGEGLERIFAAIAEDGSDGLRDRLVDDGVVASLMLIHDLYPVPLEQRVQEGLDSVRPYMESHGGNVELLGIENGIARLRLEGSCNGCAASASTLELAVEQALQATAPDLEGIDVEGVVEPPVGAFELPMVGGGAPVSGWQALDGFVPPAPGALATASSLVIANVAGDLLAYRNRCAGCGGALDHGDLSGGTLVCPTCRREFDLPRAGRSDEEGVQLSPVPLLREGDTVRVAVA
jgi:Fe-S cluster biogenesis protein NfuA/nitrite reductase/ring-hydroxylating ferredoxin subunit